jgi:hypothetical protein
VRHCDLVITFAKGRRIWIEVKGAWKYYCYENETLHNYYGYLFFPLKKVAKKSHSAAQDLRKLEVLGSRDADYVGLLLVGFDSTLPDADMTTDIGEFVRLAKIDRRPWTESKCDSWPDRYFGEQCLARIRSWFWRRPV